MVLGAPLVAAAIAACGGGHALRPERTVGTPASQVLRTTCAQSWWPNATTFQDRAWRKASVIAGPVTFMNAKRLARAAVEPNTSVKIRTLVRPRTSITLAIDRDSEGQAGVCPAEQRRRSWT